MTRSSTDPLGGANDIKLTEMLSKGSIPDPDGDPVPWDASWMKTFDSWSDSDDAPVLLLFAPMPRLVGDQLGGKQLTLFAQNPSPPSSGAYVVGRVGTTYAWRLPLDGSFDDLCAFIGSSPTLARLPLVVLRRQKRRMYFFASGLGAQDDPPVEISLDRVESHLDWPTLAGHLSVFESECLNTLEMMPKIWSESGKWFPNENAELVIHDYLLIALRMIFRGFTTMSEVNLPVGRADILLQPRDPSVPTRALVELKVLRTFSYTGGTEYDEKKWEAVLEEGRLQAVNYAQKAGAAIKGICAYDMRKVKSKDVIESARLACALDGVELCDYKIQNNVAAVRRELSASSAK